MEKQNDILKQTFESNLRIEFHNWIKQREDRPNPKPGFEYKKDAYDRLKQEGKLSLNFFIQEAYLIIQKKSKQPAIIRKVFQTLVSRSIARTQRDLNSNTENYAKSV